MIEKKRKFKGTSKDIEKLKSGVQKETHDENKKDKAANKRKIVIIGVGVLLFFVVILFELSFASELIISFTGYLLIGGGILKKAIRNLIKGQVMDENFLMSIATLGAFSIGEYPEGIAVMLFYRIGEFLQDLAVERSRKSVISLMDLRPDYANLKVGNDIKKVDPNQVRVGDYILVKPGEKVPLDGVVIEGESMTDTSALTGESVPKKAKVGNVILSGTINNSGLLTVKVTMEYRVSTVSKILDLVRDAAEKKAPTENFITKFAKYYTPAIVFSALALAVVPPLATGEADFSKWVYRALVFLVVSCPCALVISIPLGFFGGIGGASKKGVLVKGGNFLEALNHVDTVVFDKTGTLTKGVFNVTEVLPTGSFSEDVVLHYAAYAESYSSHPIALTIRNAYGKSIDKSKISEYDEISGYGIKMKLDGKTILVGSERFLLQENIPVMKTKKIGTVVHIAVDGIYAGLIIISDEVKEDSYKTVKTLKEMGAKKIVMLTGDNHTISEKIGRELGMDEVYAELLPHQKVEKVEWLESHKTSKGKVVFVGDGMNDAPVLARAEIGVAMGGAGSDAAIEAADVVLMTDQPSKLVDAMKIARRTKKIVWQNIFLAFSIKLIVLVLGTVGIATMWEAVFADVGVALVAVFNAMRLSKSCS